MAIWETLLGQSIKVEVDYYDAEHALQLAKYPTAKKIEEIVAHGINVPVPQFLAYFLFHRVRAARSRYNSYATVRSAIPDAYGMLADFLALKDGALFVSDGTDSLPRHVTEYLGDSIALSVVNEIHGLSEADWLPIPERTSKTLDYERASDGNYAVQVEAKGSVVDNSRLKSSSISNHKGDIAEKKAISASDGLTLRYGAISAISRTAQNVRCWLLDPVPIGERSPRDLRILARLRFLRWIIWLVSPRSQLATALSTRILAIEALKDPFEVNGVPLGRPDGKPFSLEYADTRGDRHALFFGSRSRVLGGPAGGIVVPLRRDALLFIGLRTQLLELAAEQDFERMLQYKAEIGWQSKRVLCIVPSGEFDRFDIDKDQLPKFSRSGGYVRFESEGRLSYSQEGLVFGVLPLQSG